MCGINGIIEKQSSKKKISSALTKMNNLIIHRGPDEDGFVAAQEENYTLGMAMRRLSIIDLTSGKQPIYSDDKKIVIVFNGEIYNYRILRSKLEKEKNTKFHTTSDTEVILKLYEAYGVESFKWLDGMFGFSIHDKNKEKLYIARDFFGEKPLYYTQNDSQFIWASELKSIVDVINVKPELSKKGVNLFLRLTYVPAPYTIYKNVFKLEANHYIEYDLNTHTFETYEICEETPPKEQEIDFEKAKADVKELVYESVDSRSIADVPLGTFLSGGVDSSIVSLCLSQATSKKIDTFSIGFKKSSDESEKAETVAKLINSNHHLFKIGEEDLEDNIHEILMNFDEPFSDTAALPTYFVSKKTKDHVKVALTGDGGDEVFGGYNKYYVGKMNSRYTSVVPKPIHNVILNSSKVLLATKSDNRGRRFKIKKMLKAVDYGGNSYWDIISLANTERELEEILLPEVYEHGLFDDYKEKLESPLVESLTDFRHVDKILSLEGGMLAKVDRTSMQNSLECRAPFLNKKIWDYTNTLPESYLMKGWNKKHILKEAFKDQFPEDFLELSKSGFGSPVGDWLKSSLKKELESYIEKDFLLKQGIFNPDKIIPLVKNHLSSKRDNTFRVWAYFCFQKWYNYIYLNN
ncbi:asparagine synthase (glutamine-hydrolyzing) [Hyunsoonleella sp. SJ7]|uniref:asparagine synthase (glutamine-hydrolyzing) n=1 Tax=Hyunsoonleella aquatilis TaxID=2762758 RepID=A0A923KGS6_9FLAO|nr:asparagine synthase (glutamine-hydrolyzing) [Hyunsoonleella aquatilis]MBC3758991.1 asparagine synthase (glutamine-hydrolyzing) [Hyunsoonleella aquatilis]